MRKPKQKHLMNALMGAHAAGIRKGALAASAAPSAPPAAPPPPMPMGGMGGGGGAAPMGPGMKRGGPVKKGHGGALHKAATQIESFAKSEDKEGKGEAKEHRRGGRVKRMARGGHVGGRGDGIAQRGHTKGRIC